jgi:hypothetical protein
MSDPELHEITLNRAKVEPVPSFVVSRRGFIILSERLVDCEHENRGLRRLSNDEDLPPNLRIALADLPACTHHSRVGACRS